MSGVTPINRYRSYKTTCRPVELQSVAPYHPVDYTPRRTVVFLGIRIQYAPGNLANTRLFLWRLAVLCSSRFGDPPVHHVEIPFSRRLAGSFKRPVSRISISYTGASPTAAETHLQRASCSQCPCVQHAHHSHGRRPNTMSPGSDQTLSLSCSKPLCVCRRVALNANRRVSSLVHGMKLNCTDGDRRYPRSSRPACNHGFTPSCLTCTALRRKAQ